MCPNVQFKSSVPIRHFKFLISVREQEQTLLSKELQCHWVAPGARATVDGLACVSMQRDHSDLGVEFDIDTNSDDDLPVSTSTIYIYIYIYI